MFLHLLHSSVKTCFMKKLHAIPSSCTNFYTNATATSMNKTRLCQVTVSWAATPQTQHHKPVKWICWIPAGWGMLFARLRFRNTLKQLMNVTVIFVFHCKDRGGTRMRSVRRTWGYCTGTLVPKQSFPSALLLCALTHLVTLTIVFQTQH